MEFNKPDEQNGVPKENTQGDFGEGITLDFSAFILSLSSSALVGLGELPDPVSKEKKTNIPLAKQMIDIVNMLRDKTKGNLTKEEEELINGLCSELKMKYIQSVNFK